MNPLYREILYWLLVSPMALVAIWVVLKSRRKPSSGEAVEN